MDTLLRHHGAKVVAAHGAGLVHVWLGRGCLLRQKNLSGHVLYFDESSYTVVRNGMGPMLALMLRRRRWDES